MEAKKPRGYRVSLHLEQNDSQSEEINVTDESQAEKRPVPVQEAQKIPYAAHSLFRLGEMLVKAGFVSTLLAG